MTRIDAATVEVDFDKLVEDLTVNQKGYLMRRLVETIEEGEMLNELFDATATYQDILVLRELLEAMDHSEAAEVIREKIDLDLLVKPE